MPLPSEFGFLFFLFLRPDFVFGVTVVLYQWDVAGTHVAATATLDATEQVVILGFVELLGAGVPIQLLRQQIGRADLYAGPAADTGHHGLLRRQFRHTGGENAIGRLGNRHLVAM